MAMKYAVGIIFLIVWSVSSPLLAQEPEPFGETTTTNPFAKPDKLPRERTIWILYSTDTEKVMAGNVCFEEATEKMGFQYVLMPKEGAVSLSGYERFKNNFWVSVGMCFRRGPWWPLVVNHRRKRCRILMGDFPG